MKQLDFKNTVKAVASAPVYVIYRKVQQISMHMNSSFDKSREKLWIGLGTQWYYVCSASLLLTVHVFTK